MKIPINCIKCLQDKNYPTPQPVYAEYRDDNRYELLCPNGHNTVVVLQHLKFEILYEIGAYALIDGFYREAVGSFTTSLERFYEFCVKALLYQKMIDVNVIQTIWKTVGKSSERELGAFIVAYLLEIKSAPEFLSEADTNFRNNVIHKGKILTYGEAFSYGEKILSIIRPILLLLKSNFEFGVFLAMDEYLKISMPSNDKNIMKSYLIIETILGLSNYGGEHRTLKESIEILKERRINLTSQST